MPALRVPALALLASLAILILGCGGEEPLPGPTTLAPREALAPAPDWVLTFCRRADRAIGKPFLCPTRVPADLQPTANLDILRPSRFGYLFEGEADEHWVFGALQPRELRDFGPPQRVGRTQVRRHPARWLFAGEEGGIFAGHLILSWREGAFVYAVSAHTDDPASRELRDRLLEVAKSLKRR